MSARMEGGHRWSGWPGAYCMYCFIEDPREICLADGHELDCTKCMVLPCSIPDEEKDEMDAKYNPPLPPAKLPPPKP